MLGRKSDSEKAHVPEGDVPWADRVIFVLACALVIGTFAWSAEPGFQELKSPRAEDSYYNLLVQGFRAGQLNLKREAPPELARLADPYDPAVNTGYAGDLPDISYYKGKFYLYFGVTPALVLFWPYAALTGHYLRDRDAVIIFFTLGFLVAAGILHAVWRRYFPGTSIWVVVAGVLALGLATGMLVAVSLWCDVYEVAVCSGFAFTMLTLAALWRALHDRERPVLWLLLASLAYGLTIGSRPSLLFGGTILLIPAVRAWFAAEPGSRRRSGWLSVAAVGSVAIIGLGLMIYNALRFENPLEFGWHYQLQGGYRPDTAQPFSLRYLGFNLWYYFFQPVRWSQHFPFLQSVPLPPLPTNYFGVGTSYGGIIPVGYPLVWMVLAAPLVWQNRPAQEMSVLRWFGAAVFLLFAVCGSTICLFFSASSRYALDFLPALMLVAGMGILGLERAPIGSAVGWRIARRAWCLLLAYSMISNLLATVAAHAQANFFAGNFLVRQGRAGEAIEYFQKALALEPESAAFHGGLGTAFYQLKRTDEAIVQYQKALAIDPHFAEAAEAQNNLGYALLRKGQANEAIIHFQKALEMQPDFAEARNTLGDCFLQIGRVNEAIVQFQKVLEIKPDFSEAYNNLGYSFLQLGRPNEAVTNFQKALELNPDFAKAWNNLGYALFQMGRVNEAIPHFQRALVIKPDFAEAELNLGVALYQSGRVDEAVVHFKKAVALQPRLTQAYNDLGNAYRRKGMATEAMAYYQRAMALEPPFIPAQMNLAWMLATWPDASVRDGDKAVALAEQADQYSGHKDPRTLRTLAAAYAEVGRFPEASVTAKQAMALAVAQSDAALTNELQTEIGLYQKNSPCRSTNN